MAAIPDVVTGTAIATTWGDAVKDALNLSIIRAIRITTDQSIVNDTLTTLILNSIEREDDEAASLSLNTATGVLTINHSAWYDIAAGVQWAAGATGYRSIQISIGGAAVAGSRVPAQNIAQFLTCSTHLYVPAGSTITADVRHTQGAALNASAARPTFLSAARMRVP